MFPLVSTFSISILAIVTLSVAALADESAPINVGRMTSEVMLAKITVSNMRKSFDFYTKVIGLKEVRVEGLTSPPIDDPNRDSALAEICLNFSGSLADSSLCLIKQKDFVTTPSYTKLTWLGIKTADTRATLRRTKAAGYDVKSEAAVFRGMVVGIVNDPDGYTVEILQAPSVKAGMH